MSTLSNVQEMLSIANAFGAGVTSPLEDSVADLLRATSAEKLGEAKDTLGDDFYKFVPMSRKALRMLKEEATLQHEIELMKQQQRKAKAEADIAEAAAERFKSLSQDQLKRLVKELDKQPSST